MIDLFSWHLHSMDAPAHGQTEHGMAFIGVHPPLPDEEVVGARVARMAHWRFLLVGRYISTTLLDKKSAVFSDMM